MEQKKIRVAQIIGKWVGGGVEAVVMNYYRNIDKDKIQFDFICDEDSTKIPVKEIEKFGGKVILVPPYQKIFRYFKSLKKVLKNGKYEIVHSHINTLSIFSLFAAKCAKVPIRIAHSHSTTNRKERNKNLIKQILRPFSKVFATDYMCCSEFSGRWLFGNKEYDKANVFLLNNAIEIDKFKFNEIMRKQVRKELNIRDNTFVIGHIGRFVEQKNHTFVIDVFNEIHIKNKDTLLLLIGQGPLQDKIKDKVDKLGLNDNVIFLGQRQDTNKLYQAMDVFILPSLYEGLPVVGIEAQASGLLCFLSTDMTEETKILETTNFIPLNLGAKQWCDKILKDVTIFNRNNGKQCMELKSFDILKEAIKLENKYIELITQKNNKKDFKTYKK